MNPLQPGVDTNNATPKTIHTRSFFGPDTLGYKMFDTHRFGEYHPHFVLDGVPDDKNITLNCAHDLRSYTLGAPLMEDIFMKKDYFAVPLPCILPLNWEKWFKNPKIGDDVDDEVGPSVTNFWTKVAVFVAFLKSGLDSIVNNEDITDNVKLVACFRYWIINEMFYSNGNLLKSLGISGNPYFEGAYYFEVGERKVSFDRIFDYVINQFIQSDIESFDVMFSDGNSYHVIASADVNPAEEIWNTISLRSFLALIRDDLNFECTSINAVPDADYAGIISALQGEGLIYNGCLKGDIPLDLRKVWAYQLSCVHFYTNDNVDFVYSAELYRELIRFYVENFNRLDEVVPETFSYNGLDCRYDSLCGYYFTITLGLINSTNRAASFLASIYREGGENFYVGIFGYLSAAFSYRRSLRYKDYFTGSRPRPLAVGDDNVAVNDGVVNVINMASGFQKTRFWNAVSRARTGVRNYLREIFGSDLPYDMHDPMWLAHTSDSIFGVETENTGEGQLTLANSVTSILRSNAAKYAFNFDVDVPCVIIGITFYDIPRVYSRATERTNFHSNRFDDFNPFLQFVGDQVVTKNELGLQIHQEVENFGYQLRHMEYKQRFDQCAGGFCENLPGYVFLADDDRFSHGEGYISPDFIRSLCTELDRYYVSLTGFSLGSYFHFIVKNNNNSSASRPMALAPSIL